MNEATRLRELRRRLAKASKFIEGMRQTLSAVDRDHLDAHGRKNLAEARQSIDRAEELLRRLTHPHRKSRS